MTASNREAAISKTLQYEGGFVDDPRDPGGATNWGITITDARKYWKPDASPADVKAMPKAVAIDIYRQKYWAKLGCDDRASGPDFVEFDTGVNSGVARVSSWRNLFDPLNLSPVDYVHRFCAKRSSFLHSLRTWSVFGKGWGSRVADVEATGVRMAISAAGKPVVPTLKQKAAEHAKKSIAHSTAAATGSVATPKLPDALPALPIHSALGIDLIWAGVGILVVLGITYLIWNAVQHAHRSTAYLEAMK